MTIDVNKLKDFYWKMDWEGGYEGIVRYGVNDTGDDQLNNLFDELEIVIEKLDNRWQELHTKHPEIGADFE